MIYMWRINGVSFLLCLWYLDFSINFNLDLFILKLVLNCIYLHKYLNYSTAEKSGEL